MHSGSRNSIVNGPQPDTELLLGFGAMILEGRMTSHTPRIEANSRISKGGPHCLDFLSRIGIVKNSPAHLCNPEHFLCARYLWFSRCFLALWKVKTHVLVEVLLAPLCVPQGRHGNHSGFKLMEQWSFSTKSNCSNKPVISNIQSLCSAVRSCIYFSQISAWLQSDIDNDIYFPQISPNVFNFNKYDSLSIFECSERISFNLNVIYRLTIPDEKSSTVLNELHPIYHNFAPTNISEDVQMHISLMSFPRVEKIPKLICDCCLTKAWPIVGQVDIDQFGHIKSPLASCSSENILNTVVDDRMKISCQESGKHRCVCDDEAGEGSTNPPKIRHSIIASDKHRLQKHDNYYLKCIKIDNPIQATYRQSDENKQKAMSVSHMSAPDINVIRPPLYMHNTHLCLNKVNMTSISTQTDFVEECNKCQLIGQMEEQVEKKIACVYKLNKSNNPQCEAPSITHISNNSDILLQALHRTSLRNQYKKSTLSCDLVSLDHSTSGTETKIYNTGEINLDSCVDVNYDMMKRNCDELKCDSISACDKNNLININKLNGNFGLNETQIKFCTNKHNNNHLCKNFNLSQNLICANTKSTDDEPSSSVRRDNCFIKDTDNYVLCQKAKDVKFNKHKNLLLKCDILKKKIEIDSLTINLLKYHSDDSLSFGSSSKIIFPSMRYNLNSPDVYGDDELERNLRIMSLSMYQSGKRIPGTSQSTRLFRRHRPLLGCLEETLLRGRILPQSVVVGYRASIGASGCGWDRVCSPQITIPVDVNLFMLEGTPISTPYTGHIKLPRKGYTVPRVGRIQVTLLNSLGSVVRIFVVSYDLHDMPASSRTFLRQRTIIQPELSFLKPCIKSVDSVDIQPVRDKQHESGILRYAIHLRFQTGHTGRLFLYSEISMLLMRRSDRESPRANSPDLFSYSVMPSPKYSPRE